MVGMSHEKTSFQISFGNSWRASCNEVDWTFDLLGARPVSARVSWVDPLRFMSMDCYVTLARKREKRFLSGERGIFVVLDT